MGNVVSDAPSSRRIKSSSSSKSGDRKSSSSISSKNSSISKNRIYWSFPKYWPYLAASLKNARETELSKDDEPRFGDLVAETVPRQTVHNALKSLGNNPIILENVSSLLKHSLLPQDIVIFIQDIIRKRD